MVFNNVEVDLLLAVVSTETVEKKFTDMNYDGMADITLDPVTAKILYGYQNTL